MSGLELHDVCVCTVYNSGIHHSFSRIRLFLKDIHRQLQHLVAIGRINKGGVQHTIKNKFKSISFTRQSVDADKHHFLFPSHFLGGLISPRSYTVIMSIYGINLRITTEHTIHFHFCRATLPGSIRLINQFDVREVTDGSHKTLMPFHSRSRTT